MKKNLKLNPEKLRTLTPSQSEVANGGLPMGTSPLLTRNCAPPPPAAPAPATQSVGIQPTACLKMSL
jgi:hypothetical protein